MPDITKIVITGDVTQIDLPPDKTSGLKEALKVLENIPDIAICRLSASDVVRHALVQSIVAAYDKYENSKTTTEKKPPMKNYRKR